ncbi:hypothetical protein ABTF55_21270, partial [Acinetobacter baumannii]
FADSHVRSGKLLPVLEDWKLEDVNVWAVFPGRRLMPARTRAFLDALQSEFEGSRCEKIRTQIKTTKAGARKKLTTP